MSHDHAMYEPPQRAIAKFEDGRADEELLLGAGGHVKPSVNLRKIEHTAFKVICTQRSLANGHVCAVLVEHRTRPEPGEDDSPWVLSESLLPGIPMGMQLVTGQGIRIWLGVDVWPAHSVMALCGCGLAHELSVGKLRDLARCHPLLPRRDRTRTVELSKVLAP